MQFTPSQVEVAKLACCSDAAFSNLTPEDYADLQGALESVLRAVLAKDELRKSARGDNGRSTRWWTHPDVTLLCPLTGFPIWLLPYPPFKLRTDAELPGSYHLVDGKFLAMSMIATGCHEVCGRQMQASDIEAIDDYMHRRKLGPHRPGRAAALEKEVQKSSDLEHQAKARRELDSIVRLATAELRKLRYIQENRLHQINSMLPDRAQASLKSLRKSLLSKIDRTSLTVSKQSSASKHRQLSPSAISSAQTIISGGSSKASQK
eukprot:TRINITY_DN9009_c0_g1_i2.p1 TRINITY_DN9009_c0_g1~~TRINITY_DN9009_c0_g1_i2.p1  ORF type:complete len:296 (-),score=51.83 TRINITY_DN9009_c0_g1_i2:69-857(-)